MWESDEKSEYQEGRTVKGTRKTVLELGWREKNEIETDRRWRESKKTN